MLFSSLNLEWSNIFTQMIDRLFIIFTKPALLIGKSNLPNQPVVYNNREYPQLNIVTSSVRFFLEQFFAGKVKLTRIIHQTFKPLLPIALMNNSG